jgi:hypothetical protein
MTAGSNNVSSTKFRLLLLASPGLNEGIAFPMTLLNLFMNPRTTPMRLVSTASLDTTAVNNDSDCQKCVVSNEGGRDDAVATTEAAVAVAEYVSINTPPAPALPNTFPSIMVFQVRYITRAVVDPALQPAWLQEGEREDGTSSH